MVKYAGLVSDFLDPAAGAGVRHVTYLNAYGSDQAPPEVDIRDVARKMHTHGPCDRRADDVGPRVTRAPDRRPEPLALPPAMST
jgi:hypothetical protein